MSLRNKICPVCNKNIVKNFYAKSCMKCRDFKGSKNPRYKAKSVCKECGGKCDRHTKTNRCDSCYRKTLNGLPKCKICGGNLARYETPKRKTTEICQKCYRGEVTKRWNPSISPELRKHGRTINPEYYEWRNEVFKRDGYACVLCGDNRGHNLNAHHLDGFSTAEELRVSLDNGVTLCESCHKDFHKEYSYFNNTKKQWDEYACIHIKEER